MQLDPGPRSAAPSALRARLGAAACVLIAAGAPAVARGAGDAPTWQLDATGLVYSEKARATIVEPVARITRLFADGSKLSGQVALDAMTGASPSGAMPSGKIQTVTTASGTVHTSAANEVPTKPFRDFRSAFDLAWDRPVGRYLTFSAGGHFSHEKDYQSVGANGSLSVELMNKLTTVTLGGGVNHDGVSPVGGTRVGMSDGTARLTTGTNRKQVDDALVGFSHVLTRRLLVGVNGSQTRETGYLTEPYKVISVLDGTGVPQSELTENRPRTRLRHGVLGSSVYHFTRDVGYATYRYYWDDWGVRSHTVDLRYRNELPDDAWIQPHVRFYTQTPADFFVFGLPPGPAANRPKFASSDFRLGPLRTLTLGATYGFKLPGNPAEFTLRGEYMRQWGDGRPASAIGVQRQLDLFPAEDIFSFVAGYTLEF